MAYVVTVRLRYGACTDPTHDHSYEDGRRTVETLVEARDTILTRTDDPVAWAWAKALPFDGPGSVGPLFDGSTFDVAVADA